MSTPPATRMTSRPPGAATPHVVVNVHGFGTGPATSALPSTSFPWICTVYAVHTANGLVCVRVRTVFPFVRDPDRAMFGKIVHARLGGGFIGSLNVTTIAAVSGTPVAAFAGFVDRICGDTQTALNVHGFGLEPVTLIRFPPVVFCAYTVIEWVTQSGNRAVWLNVTRVSPLLHAAERRVFGVSVHNRDPGFAASLKSTMMLWSRSTSCCRLAGTVLMM